MSTFTLVGTILAGTALLAATAAQQSGDTSIRPFTFHASEDALGDLRGATVFGLGARSPTALARGGLTFNF